MHEYFSLLSSDGLSGRTIQTFFRLRAASKICSKLFPWTLTVPQSSQFDKKGSIHAHNSV